MIGPPVLKQRDANYGLSSTNKYNVFDFLKCCKFSKSTRDLRHALKYCSAKRPLYSVYSNLITSIGMEIVNGPKLFEALFDAHGRVRFVKRSSTVLDVLFNMISCLRNSLHGDKKNWRLLHTARSAMVRSESRIRKNIRAEAICNANFFLTPSLHQELCR